MNAKELTLFLTILTTRLERELARLNQTLATTEHTYPDLVGLDTLVSELQSAISMLESMSLPELHPIPTVSTLSPIRYN